MRCSEHKRYKAKLKPRCDCFECWQMFLEQTADYNDICKELEKRTPTLSPGTSYFRDWGPEPIIDMLRAKKKELEEDNE